MSVDLKEILSIARDAGELILEHRRAGFSVEAKHDDSPVTEADTAANEHIVTALRASYPELPIVAEESSLPLFEERKKWKSFWLVDPLDGTKEFIKGANDFTVNIALVTNGKPVLGVVFAPAKNVLYYAEESKGSWRVNGNGRPERLLSASSVAPYKIVMSASHPSPTDETFLENVRVSGIVRAGSSLKFCAVAEGRADLYPRFAPCMEWDVAAGDAVYRYACTRGENFSPLVYNKQNLLNGPFVIGRPARYHLPKSGVILLTGLSGSGKTTIGLALCKALDSYGYSSEFLDGDKLREEFPQTDFSREGRIEHLLRAGARAGALAREGKLVVLALIAPYASSRERLRKACDRFWEIHIATPLDVCEQRDVKGLYAKARAGEIKRFTGIDDPYEAPSSPDLKLDTSKLPQEASLLLILECLGKSV